jgi:hypothetical protein
LPSINPPSANTYFGEDHFNGGRSNPEATTKRWAYDPNSISEAAWITLSSNGRAEWEQDFAAGADVYVNGAIITQKWPVLYGSIGGIPAVNLQ